MAESPEDPALDLLMVRDAVARKPEAVAALGQRLRCVPRILSALNARLGRPLGEHDLADTVQDTIVTVLRKLADYAGHGVLEAWVFRICSFEMLNAARRRRRQHLDSELPEESLTDAAAAREWQLLLARDTLEAGIRRVGGVEAEALRMKHFDGLSFDEMATRQQISTPAVKARYYRALARLEELMRADAPEEG